MNFLKNIQFQQLINLFLLLLIAQYNNTLQASWLIVLTLSLFAILFELTIINLKSLPTKHQLSTINYQLYIPYSAVITVFGIVLMIGWIAWYIPFILTALALLQKKYLIVGGKHIFNPSNFAVVLALAIFYPKALPIIGQLGYQGYIAISVTILLAIFILYRVNRLIIPIVFSFVYIALEWLIIGHSNPNWELTHFLTKFYTTSFIVYLFFMLTDPITTPDSTIKQTIFALLVATALVSLDYIYTPRVWNLFLALFFVSALFVPLYRKLEKDDWVKYTTVLAVSIILIVTISKHQPHYFSM